MSFIKLIYHKDERSLKDVPVHIIIILSVALLSQVYWASHRSMAPINISKLNDPPTQIESRLLSLGDAIAISKLFMLWLQAFDNQPGVSVPFKDLDYRQVIKWLERILLLDPKGQYPLLAAGRVYAVIEDEHKKRLMLDFIDQQFLVDPNRRWPSMMHAIYIAKHRLEDLPLALKYAHSVAKHVTDDNVPFWVKQMEIYVLEDMGEIESAKVLIGGLLESGAIKDAHELQFLQDRLNKLENKE